MKTLAIRLEEDQHAQLGFIAQLEELTVTDAIRQAIEQWIGTRRDSPELKQRAQAVLDTIEQEAATRRSAIAALLGSEPSEVTRSGKAGDQTASGVRRSRDKGESPASS